MLLYIDFLFCYKYIKFNVLMYIKSALILMTFFTYTYSIRRITTLLPADIRLYQPETFKLPSTIVPTRILQVTAHIIDTSPLQKSLITAMTLAIHSA